MEALFAEVNHWHWWILAVSLLVLEALVPGAFFLWMGVAAIVVGGLVLILPGMGWEYQVFIFAALSVASIVAWRAYLKKNPTETELPTLNRRGEQYVGRIFTLSDPIVNGQGKIRVDDTSWKIEGVDCEAGSRVRVVGVDGVMLRVEPIE